MNFFHLFLQKMSSKANHIAHGFQFICWIFLLHSCVGFDTYQPIVDGSVPFKVVRDPSDNVTTTFVSQTVNITFTITDVLLPGEFTVTVVPKDEEDFRLTFDELHMVSSDDNDLNVTMEVSVTGTQLIISEFDIVATGEDGARYKLLTHFVKIRRVPNRVALIIRYLVLAAVIVTIWLIGITTDIMLIVRIVKRPYGVIIGMICQFAIMPFTAWSLAKLFQIDGAASVGLVLDGSCPGGTNSNLFSVLLDVDYVLSITMTFFSTIIALGMMPLNLFIYGSSFVAAGETIRTPFLEIFIQLLFLVIPLGIGIFLGWRWPKMKDFADKYIKPASALVVVVLICTDLPFNLFIFDSPWQYYAASIIFPFVGGTSGFILTKLAKLSTRKALTVALETGVQNAVLAVTVLFFFYPQPEADLATRLPYLILIFTTIEGLALVLMYTLLKKFYWHGAPYDDGDQDGGEEVKETDAYIANNNDTKESDNIATISTGVLVSKMDGGNQAELGPDTLADAAGHRNLAYRPDE